MKCIVLGFEETWFCGRGFGQVTCPFLGLIPHLSNEDLGQCGEYAQSLFHKS